MQLFFIMICLSSLLSLALKNLNRPDNQPKTAPEIKGFHTVMVISMSKSFMLNGNVEIACTKFSRISVIMLFEIHAHKCDLFCNKTVTMTLWFIKFNETLFLAIKKVYGTSS